MAVVKGLKEKVHNPLYDSISVEPGKQLGDALTTNILRFFQEVTRKNKLQTNMQAASLLPHWNTYEARALRVVISDLSAQASVTNTVEHDVGELSSGGRKGKLIISARSFAGLKREIERLELSQGLGKQLEFTTQDQLDARDLKLIVSVGSPASDFPENELGKNEKIVIDRIDLREIQDKDRSEKRVLPLDEQIFPNDGFGTLIGKFIYNTVTTFFVGEKIMIQVPTWFFPAGAGPYSENGKVTTHGYPNPQATFRFAEPVTIDAQQNFRVEIEVPDGDVLKDLQRLYGPLFIWVALDGYMTRDVQ